MKIMRICKIFLAAVFILSLSLTAKAELVDRIVAVVNNDVVTLSDLNNAGQPYFQAIMRKVPVNRQGAELSKARKEILHHLVDQLLIKQQAEKIGIEVSKEDIDQAINSIITGNNISMEKLRQGLKSMGTSEAEYREKIKGEILKSRLINFEIRSKIVITAKKIKEYYEQNYSAKQTNAKGYHIMQIGFSWGDKYRIKTREEALEKAKSVRQKLLAGENFQELAHAFSDLPSSEDGGDIGQFKKEELAPYMKETVLSMHVGEISEILNTPAGYQILKLVAAPGHEKPKLASVKEEIKAILYKQEEEKNYDDWLTDLRKKAFIKYSL